MEDASASAVPGFLSKLWSIVDDTVLDDVIRWSENGESFCIVNEPMFAKKVLPKFFKHSNIASFTRQLNIYGFRKVIKLKKAKTGSKAKSMEFQHPHFKKGGESFLENIKRKGTAVKLEDVGIYSHDDLQRMMIEVQQMKAKQTNMNVMFAKQKRQYAALRLEMKNLRRKYGEQQQMLTQILQFIWSVISETPTVNTNKQRSLPAISEALPFKSVNQHFHIPEEKKKEAMEILKDGYAIIEDKYKNLLDSYLPTLKDECKILASSVDQDNGDCGEDSKMSSQDVPQCEDSDIPDLSLAIPDLQELMAVESLGEETKDISLDIQSFLSQDIDLILTEDKSDIPCDIMENRDEMHYISGDLMEPQSPLSKKNMNYSSDNTSEPINSELQNLMTIENETLLDVHVMAETDSLSLMKTEGEMSLLDADGTEDETLMNYFVELQDSSDLTLDDLKNPSNILPDLCDNDYVSLNIPSQQYVVNPVEDIMPELCMETDEEFKLPL
ncbi:heat shock factor protein 3 [Fukomys damarensis]|uniref:heat shock factor protein 3 n=1 Tax=Fukomys damarensis TaxID=885580 RepID=UPI0008FEE6B9|nr:heat shock factor protein 3 [Fukomys damarensis]